MENDMKRDDLIRRSDALNCSHIGYIEYLETDDGGYIEGDADCIPVVKKRDIESIPAVDAVEVVWLPVVGYEGLYEISNFGNVRTVDGDPVRQSISRKRNTCYKTVWLKKEGQGQSRYVHRLVAEAFIPNVDRLPIVNHKDEDKTNNFAENLEWCTNEYNVNYGTGKSRRVKKIRGRVSPHAVLVEAFGERRTRKEWGEMYGIDPHNIERRMSRGWDAEKAITTPLMKNQYAFRGQRREDGDGDVD